MADKAETTTPPSVGDAKQRDLLKHAASALNLALSELLQTADGPLTAGRLIYRAMQYGKNQGVKRKHLIALASTPVADWGTLRL